MGVKSGILTDLSLETFDFMWITDIPNSYANYCDGNEICYSD